MLTVETDSGVYLEGPEDIVLFVPRTMQLFSTPRGPDSITLEAWLEAHPQRTARAGAARERRRVYDRLDHWPSMIPMLDASALEGMQPPRRRAAIARLTLNISNACNLWCSYCYADHGYYHSPASLMPPERAVAIMERVLELYASVGLIQFFGGEPLANLPAIEAVGRFLEEQVERGRLRRMPAMVATTNGTYSDEKTLDVLTRWKMSLTVSCDGPRAVHDAARPTVSGGSSYDKIVQSLQCFTASGVPFDIECTYNHRHRDADVSVVDLMRFFAREFGQTVVHISPSFLPRSAQSGKSRQQIFRGEALRRQIGDNLQLEDLIPLYREAARATVANIFAQSGPQLEFAKRITEQILTQKASSSYCPAFFDQLSIAIDGSVYPCFMFISDQNFYMGNILESEFPNPQSAAVVSRYLREFGRTASGTDKWYAPLSSGCIAGDYISTNSLDKRWLGPLFEAMAEECLTSVAHHSARFSETA